MDNSRPEADHCTDKGKSADRDQCYGNWERPLEWDRDQAKTENRKVRHRAAGLWSPAALDGYHRGGDYRPYAKTA